MTPLARTLAVAALGTAALTAPVAAHAYVTPDQTGHGSGSFEVCTAPTGPAPWVYVVAARDPRIIRVPEDSWTFARTDGSWVRAKAADGRARVVTTVPLTGQVGDTIKVRAPGTDATADLRLVAVKAPSCEPDPTPTPTGTPTPSPTPSVTPTPEETPWTPSPEPTGSAPAPTPSTTASVTPSQRPTTSAPSPTASCAGTGSASGCGEQLASTGADTWPLLLGGLGLLGAGAVLTVRRPGRRH